MVDPEHHAHLDPLAHVAQDDHPDRLGEARAAAGRAIRDLGHAIVGHHAPLPLVERVAATLDGLTDELLVGDRRDRAQVRREGEWGSAVPDGATMTSYDERPVSGRSSPWGLDVHVWRDGDEAVADLTLRAAHEGAPGRSHGGIVAALFDDIYGFVLSFLHQPAFTGELTVRYEAGVPIGVPLQVRVRMTHREGRKLFMTGELSDGTRVVARSRATFIAIDISAFGAGAAGTPSPDA
ncbi:MAG: PaaI family thioesterase [Ilumatobacteraceae bacterium]